MDEIVPRWVSRGRSEHERMLRGAETRTVILVSGSTSRLFLNLEDPTVLKSVYGVGRRAAKKWARSCGLDSTVSEDLLQELFCRMIDRGLPPVRRSAAAVIHGEIRNIAKEMRLARGGCTPGGLESLSVVAAPAPDTARQEAEDALRVLAVDDSLLLTWRFAEGRATQAIAHALGVSVWTIRRRLTDALVRAAA